VVGEVKTAINPNAVFGNGNVLLGVDGPLAGRGYPLALSALPPNHGCEE
jgi:hypothetical protein